MKAFHARVSLYSKKGFTIAEIMVGMFFITTMVVLVMSLGGQVMNFSKRATQTGAILEIRNLVSAVTRNPQAWLKKMRSVQATRGIYAGCIPSDNGIKKTDFTCPAINPDIVKNDGELATIAGSTFLVADSPIVNLQGELIAGTLQKPIYYTSDGRACSAETNCSLKSTGYFLRSIPKTTPGPGSKSVPIPEPISVKFIIKVEQNVVAAESNRIPMKPQYMSIDIGTDWTIPDEPCPKGTAKFGYLENGNVSCVNITKACTDSGSYAIGVDSLGNPICKKIPNCSSEGGKPGINQSGTDLECKNDSPCGENNIFLGYYGGTGEPMCSGPEVKCAEGQLQVGITIEAGKMTAECASLPESCTEANSRLAYDGEKFVCESEVKDEVVTFKRCPTGQHMVGIKSNGDIICETVQTTTTPIIPITPPTSTTRLEWKGQGSDNYGINWKSNSDYTIKNPDGSTLKSCKEVTGTTGNELHDHPCQTLNEECYYICTKPFGTSGSMSPDEGVYTAPYVRCFTTKCVKTYQ